MIKYTLAARRPKARFWQVGVELATARPRDVELVFPVWCFGSYMVRDFAQNVYGATALRQDGGPGARQIAKNRWILDNLDGKAVFFYRLHGPERSIRGQSVNDEGGLVNGAATFVFVDGMRAEPCSLRLIVPRRWGAFTTLQAANPDARSQPFAQAGAGKGARPDSPKPAAANPGDGLGLGLGVGVGVGSGLSLGHGLNERGDAGDPLWSSGSPFNDALAGTDALGSALTGEDGFFPLCAFPPEAPFRNPIRAQGLRQGPARVIQAVDEPYQSLVYAAEDYDELIDKPIALGDLFCLGVEGLGSPHAVCFSGEFRAAGLVSPAPSAPPAGSDSGCDSGGDSDSDSGRESDSGSGSGSRFGAGALADSESAASGRAGSSPILRSRAGVPCFDPDRFARDVRAVCAEHRALFNGLSPNSRYAFMIDVALDAAGGGLEHRDCCVIAATAKQLANAATGAPAQDAPALDRKPYLRLLSTVSHEYFHQWNVKAFKPICVAQSDLSAEAYTSQLWAFEGLTEYFGNLALLRSGAVSPQEFALLVSDDLQSTAWRMGPNRQSLAEASLEAWDKYYKSFPNRPNMIANYYGKGNLAGIVLDGLIARESGGKKRLDDVMRALFARARQGQTGFSRQEWKETAERATGVDLGEFYARCVDGTEPLDLDGPFRAMGLAIRRQAGDPAARITGEAPQDCGATMKLLAVREGACGFEIGLAPGDEAVAVNGIAVADRGGATGWANIAQTLQDGQEIEIAVIRAGRLLTLKGAYFDPGFDAIEAVVADEAKLKAWAAPRRA